MTGSSSWGLDRLTKSVRDPRPLSERVYETLRDRIVTGDLPADTQVRQEQVAEDLGVSRTPVREALSRLVQEELVTLVPGNGYLVNDLSDEDINHVFEVRLSLELTAARLAFSRHNSVTIAGLHALIDEMASADAADASAQFELNRQFHRALNEPCGNPLLMKIVDGLWDQPINRRITKAYLRGGQNTAAMIQEHRAIVDAVDESDGERFLLLVEQHISDGYLEAQK